MIPPQNLSGTNTVKCQKAIPIIAQTKMPSAIDVALCSGYAASRVCCSSAWSSAWPVPAGTMTNGQGASRGNCHATEPGRGSMPSL